MSLPPNKKLLSEFPNKVYVETGIYRGDSIQQALDAGFDRVIGLDNDPQTIHFCKSRFDNDKRIEFITADSAEHLFTSIREIETSMTILLDAHWQLFEGTDKGLNPFPLLNELRQIAKHPIKNHTIIIDDVLYLTHPRVTGWRLEDIIEALQDINPRYQYKLIANPIIDNMLVAWVD